MLMKMTFMILLLCLVIWLLYDSARMKKATHKSIRHIKNIQEQEEKTIQKDKKQPKDHKKNNH